MDQKGFERSIKIWAKVFTDAERSLQVRDVVAIAKQGECVNGGCSRCHTEPLARNVVRRRRLIIVPVPFPNTPCGTKEAKWHQLIRELEEENQPASEIT